MLIKREEKTYISRSEQETESIGEGLAKVVSDGELIVLTGPLGAGKTRFVMGMARGLGLDPAQVNSPSYTLVNEYHGARDLYHLDLYRLEGEEDLHNIGWDDYLSRDGMVVVEWGERAGELLPPQRIEVHIEIISETERRIGILFRGNR